MTRVNTEECAEAFHHIVATVSSSSDLRRCWQEVLNITGESDNDSLALIDIQSDLESVISQVNEILRAEPPSSDVHLLWFGLFDGVNREKEYAGYYLAGWANDEQLLGGGTPPYFPESRYISSKLLNAVKDEAVRIGGESPKFSTFDYAIMFGAAATLSRFASQLLALKYPIFVGFDSGDFACISK